MFKRLTAAQNNTIDGFVKDDVYTIEDIEIKRNGKAHVFVIVKDTKLLPKIKNLVLVVSRRGKVSAAFRYKNGKIISTF